MTQKQLRTEFGPRFHLDRDGDGSIVGGYLWGGVQYDAALMFDRSKRVSWIELSEYETGAINGHRGR